MYSVNKAFPAGLHQLLTIFAFVVSVFLSIEPTQAQEASGPENNAACVEIARRLPPQGISPDNQLTQEWTNRIEKLDLLLSGPLADHPLRADVGCLVKACRYALAFNEFYSPKDFKLVPKLLGLAEHRASELLNSTSTPESFLKETLVVRGFTSRVDGSPQPVGFELPVGWREATTRLPLYVWLHGRGEKETDLHFIDERLTSTGKISVRDAIVVHPFGRQCVGYKSAGETDVLEAIDFACREYPVDRNRIVLIGFSMGGAGVWHLAAHHTDRFIAASPGAGFAETARYQKLTPENFPPKVEQLLWSVYDVPGYTRNLFNLPLIAYSGEVDPQIQAARVMEEAFAAEGRQLPHLIGPGMGHKYHPDTLAELLNSLQAVVADDHPASPDRLYLQTKHLRYATRQWITIDGFDQAFVDTRVDASRTKQGTWQLQTKNATRLQMHASNLGPGLGDTFTVDGISMQLDDKTLRLQRKGQTWRKVASFENLRKHPGISGPIDDAFLDPFLVVLPTATGQSAVDRWVNCESSHFATRWTTLMRGNVRVKLDKDVTAEDIQLYHLILWGSPKSNSVIAKIFAVGQANHWPILWTDAEIGVGKLAVPADSHVLQGIYPNPIAANRKYVVFNSGLTFREAHDQTNSLQNPKLGDWVLLGLEEAPSDERPGQIVHTGFFNDRWQFNPDLTW